jgi:hypothetical protein
LINDYFYLGIFRLILWILQYGGDALSVESVEAREYIELSVKYRCITDITTLARVNGNVLVSLASFLVTQLFGIVSVLLDLCS